MGTLETPAPAGLPPSERTLLRSKERDSSPRAAVEGESLTADSAVTEPAAETPADSPVALLADSPAAAHADDQPHVEPLSSEPVAKRSPSVPPLPVATLERPSALRAELTPSPVPRVSLVPPTGRIDSSQLAELGLLEDRKLPTVAPRLRPTRLPGGIALHTPALHIPELTIPLRLRPRPVGLARRLANDVRSSKREIALGLVIGIVLSFVLGKLGQSYLESRSRGTSLVVQSFANEPAPRRVPAPAASQPPAASATPAVASPAAAAPRAASPSAVPPPATEEMRPREAAPSAPPSRPRPSPPRGTPPRATPAGHPPDQGATRGAPAAPASAAPPSPAESAGLGLELPL